jgi:hypothetical protein
MGMPDARCFADGIGVGSNAIFCTFEAWQY